MGNGPTKEEKLIEEIAKKETLLECPVLVDLAHGTIRHRHEERISSGDTDEDKKIKIGYFYHPRLNDFSEDAVMTQCDNNRLKYVFKGPPKDSGEKLYYIYGTKTSDKDKGFIHDEYKPQGRGYNWPQSYRKANNLYYDVIFMEIEDDEDETKSDILPIDDSVSISTGITAEISAQQKDNITLKLRSIESVSAVIDRISLQLLIPSSNIHLMVNRDELSNKEVLGDFRPEENRSSAYYTVMLRLT